MVGEKDFKIMRKDVLVRIATNQNTCLKQMDEDIKKHKAYISTLQKWNKKLMKDILKYMNKSYLNYIIGVLVGSNIIFIWLMLMFAFGSIDFYFIMFAFLMFNTMNMLIMYLRSLRK